MKFKDKLRKLFLILLMISSCGKRDILNFPVYQLELLTDKILITLAQSELESLRVKEQKLISKLKEKYDGYITKEVEKLLGELYESVEVLEIIVTEYEIIGIIEVDGKIYNFTIDKETLKVRSYL